MRPVLLEPQRQGSFIYNPNPKVTVSFESGGVTVEETWQYVQDLLEVGKEKVFTVEWLINDAHLLIEWGREMESPQRRLKKLLGGFRMFWFGLRG